MRAWKKWFLAIRHPKVYEVGIDSRVIAIASIVVSFLLPIPLYLLSE